MGTLGWILWDVIRALLAIVCVVLTMMCVGFALVVIFEPHPNFLLVALPLPFAVVFGYGVRFFSARENAREYLVKGKQVLEKYEHDFPEGTLVLHCQTKPWQGPWVVYPNQHLLVFCHLETGTQHDVPIAALQKVMHLPSLMDKDKQVWVRTLEGELTFKRPPGLILKQIELWWRIPELMEDADLVAHMRSQGTARIRNGALMVVSAVGLSFLVTALLKWAGVGVLFTGLGGGGAMCFLSGVGMIQRARVLRQVEEMLAAG